LDLLYQVHSVPRLTCRNEHSRQTSGRRCARDHREQGGRLMKNLLRTRTGALIRIDGMCYRWAQSQCRCLCICGRRLAPLGTRAWATGEGSPPPLYYPASSVSVNISTGRCFYLSAGSRQGTMALPSTVVLDGGNYFSLELETDQPSLYYPEYKLKCKGQGRSKWQCRRKGH
jgi:hypothetical protein